MQREDETIEGVRLKGDVNRRKLIIWQKMSVFAVFKWRSEE
jgi:hypothetical protein